MKTALNKVRGLGSAKEGTDHFWKQRVTAVANLFLITLFIILIISLLGSSHAEVAETLASPFWAVIVLLLIISGLVHMRLGMQVIIEDYVHGEKSKLLLLMANTFFTVLIGGFSILAVLKLAL